MKFIKENLSTLLVAGFIFFYFFDRQSGKGNNQPTEVIHRDTIYSQNTVTLPSYQPPIIVESSRPVMSQSERIFYRPDTNYANLLQQYERIIDKYFAQNIHRDSIPLDSVGYVLLNDTVSQNKIWARGVKYNYTIPEYKTTITRTNPPRRQIYVGAGIYGDQNFGINRIDLGVLYKNRKEQIFILKPSYDLKDGPGLGFESYWKIRLKKPKLLP